MLALIPYEILERLFALNVLKRKYKMLKDVKIFEKREDLWKRLLDNHDNRPITLLEFGVFEGYSIRKFSQMNLNLKSSFIGFDSFEGLPEDWIKTPKGTFNTDGRMPQIDDERVEFVKGWFQNTLPNFLAKSKINGALIVHYDADIYSATLFVLMQIDALKISYDAIFDEFTGEETRAIYNYQQITGAKVEFAGKTMSNSYPVQVSCRITPCVKYEI